MSTVTCLSPEGLSKFARKKSLIRLAFLQSSIRPTAVEALIIHHWIEGVVPWVAYISGQYSLSANPEEATKFNAEFYHGKRTVDALFPVIHHAWEERVPGWLINQPTVALAYDHAKCDLLPTHHSHVVTAIDMLHSATLIVHQMQAIPALMTVAQTLKKELGILTTPA